MKTRVMLQYGMQGMIAQSYWVDYCLKESGRKKAVCKAKVWVEFFNTPCLSLSSSLLSLPPTLLPPLLLLLLSLASFSLLPCYQHYSVI